MFIKDFIEKNKTKIYMKGLLPPRPQNGNKGDFGKVFVLGGSFGMIGAPCLSAEAALRCGAGLVTLGTVMSQQPVAAAKLTEVMTMGFDEKNGAFSGNDATKITEIINQSTVCTLGMGLSRTEGAQKTVFEVIKNAKIPLVIDADGINAVSENINILKNIKAEAVLTPHPGEMSRLLKVPISDIQKNRLAAAKEFAKKHSVVLVLKGKKTIVAAPDGRFFENPTGNCGMATAGSGDVLAGVVAAFIGQGLCAFEAAVLSVYLHGRAGDIGAEKFTQYGLKALDIVGELPSAIKELLF